MGGTTSHIGMSFGGLDLLARVRNLLNFANQREKSLKRRAEEQADYSILTKYRRVSSEFPKYINKPFEDDTLFIRPEISDNLNPLGKKTNAKKNTSNIDNKHIFQINDDHEYADLEFSDEEDNNIGLTFPRGAPLTNSSFNLPEIKPRRSLHSNEKKRREINIPIKLEKKPAPPLIDTRTGGIVDIPSLHPIRRNNISSSINPSEYTNGFVNHLSVSKKLDPPPILPMDRKPTFYTKNPNSVVAQTFNLKEKDGYLELLSKLVPNLYKTSGSRRSLYTGNFTERVDQTNGSTKFPKVTEIINLDDDEDTRAKDVIDLDDDDVEIISACQKLARKKASEPSKRELPQVEPVNTLKDKLDLTPTLQPHWLENFKQKHEETSRLRKKQIQEEEENARQLSLERQKHERLIEDKLKNIRIDTSELIILDESSSEDEEVEFPEFSKEDIALIKEAVYKGSAEEILISKFNMQIKRRDIKTLVGDSWLNDEVINFYMNLLMERSEQRSSEGLPRVYAMNTFFIPRLVQSGYSAVRRWTRKVDIFSYDVIPIPVHVGGMHWCMAIIHLKNKTIKYYDSMSTPNPRILHLLEEYLQEESLDKRRKPFDTSGFLKESVPDVPRQMNGSDCGVFSCMFAEYITRNKEISFTQQHMPYFRQKMILEIVKGKLLL